MSIPLGVVEFILRWRAKGDEYDYNRLTDCFDGFFTAYVLYNVLYDLIPIQSEIDNPDDGSSESKTPPRRGDEEGAIKVVKKFLGAEAITNDSEIKDSADEINRLIKGGYFHLVDSAWDEKRTQKLESNDPEQWSKGVLEVIYRIRCNLFHGQKAFQPSQRDLLLPCIKILRRLTDKLIEKLEPGALRRGRE